MSVLSGLKEAEPNFFTITHIYRFRLTCDFPLPEYTMSDCEKRL